MMKSFRGYVSIVYAQEKTLNLYKYIYISNVIFLFCHKITNRKKYARSLCYFATLAVHKYSMSVFHKLIFIVNIIITVKSYIICAI